MNFSIEGLPGLSGGNTPGEARQPSGGNDAEVKLWNAVSGELVHRLTGHKDDVWSLAFSPDGKTLAANGSTDVYLWKVPSCQRVGQINGMGEHIRCVRFTPDGKSIVFTREWVNKMEDRWDSEIWIMNADGSKKRFLARG